MRLSRVSVRRKHWNALFFEPETAFEGEYSKDGGLLIDTAAFDESDLREGCDCTEAQVDALIADSRRRRAYSKGLWLLDARDYSAKSLRDKLRRDFGDEAACVAVERLCEIGYVDDERYAYRLAERLMADAHGSARDVRQKLIAKGVPQDLARDAVAAASEDVSDGDSLDHWVNGKYASKLASGDPTQIKKAVNALLRKGFAYSDIRAAVQRFADGWENGNEDEYDAL